jgi:ABC-2 type transport system permease protein
MSNILTGRNVSNAIAGVVGTVSAGIRITLLEKLGEDEDGALARAVPLVSEDNYSFNAAKSYASYLVPGLLLFFLYIYMTLQYMRVIRSNETLAEKTAAFIGMIPHGVLLGLVFLYGYVPKQGLTVHSDYRLVVAILAAGFFTLAVLEVAVKLLLRRDIVVMQVSVFLAMLSLMFSGITWPTDMFPVPLQWLSAALPFTPIAQGMRILIHFPAEGSDLFRVFSMFITQCLFFGALISLSLLLRLLFHLLKKARGGRAGSGRTVKVGA